MPYNQNAVNIGIVNTTYETEHNIRVKAKAKLRWCKNVLLILTEDKNSIKYNNNPMIIPY